MANYKIHHDAPQYSSQLANGCLIDATSHRAAFNQFLGKCDLNFMAEPDIFHVYVQNIKTKKAVSYEVGIECKPILTKLDHEIGTIDGDFFHLY
jgi:hypothetical protein